MREALYPVPQGPRSILGPSRILGRPLPAEVTAKGFPLQGRVQAPLVVDPPRLIRVPVAEITKKGVLQGLVQPPVTVRPSFLFPFKAPVVIAAAPVFIPRGVIQDLTLLSASPPTVLQSMLQPSVLSAVIDYVITFGRRRGR